jgi:hypothetical protein
MSWQPWKQGQQQYALALASSNNSSGSLGTKARAQTPLNTLACAGYTCRGQSEKMSQTELTLVKRPISKGLTELHAPSESLPN